MLSCKFQICFVYIFHLHLKDIILLLLNFFNGVFYLYCRFLFLKYQQWAYQTTYRPTGSRYLGMLAQVIALLYHRSLSKMPLANTLTLIQGIKEPSTKRDGRWLIGLGIRRSALRSGACPGDLCQLVLTSHGWLPLVPLLTMCCEHLYLSVAMFPLDTSSLEKWYLKVLNKMCFKKYEESERGPTHFQIFWYLSH